MPFPFRMTSRTPPLLASRTLPKQPPPSLEDYPKEVLEAVLSILRAQERKRLHEPPTEPQ